MRKPACSLLIFCSCSAHVYNRLFKIAVKTLLTTLSSESPLLLSGFLSSLFFNSGIITDLHQSNGKWLASYSLLNKFVKKGTTKLSACFNNSPHISSSPQALPVFKFLIACLTSCSVMGLSSSGTNVPFVSFSGLAWVWVCSLSGLVWPKTLLKWLSQSENW